MMLNYGLYWRGLVVYRSGAITRGLVPITIRRRKDGYCTFKHGGRTYYVHRLVCEVFHGPPPAPDAEADHRDRDRSNNRADNLQWLTPAANKAKREFANRRIRPTPTEPQHPELRRLHEREPRQ